VRRSAVLQKRPKDAEEAGILMEMDTRIRGVRTLRTPTGNTYRFGSGRDARQIVRRVDVSHFLSRWPGIFRIVPVEER